ncbi:DarT ssDNA thymidine ADP-ribosyltransferase family protein [Phyllobacterium sp. SB3]|uniref:DarT ssDNA thymidine ADP-ribosyltransferase family protein n=1 Tax=Phyllobacterium sp. SB3 TaxID=3156073 RepID=UPI0032AF8E9E
MDITDNASSSVLSWKCQTMPTPRFIFRMTYYLDCARFFLDGELRSKNHAGEQPCHQTSYPGIVSRRGTQITTPCGRPINDHVAFYFSPLTAMAFTIHKGNVPLVAPDGQPLGTATMDDRVFFVCNIERFTTAPMPIWFSDIACNSLAPPPVFGSDVTKIEQHLEWSLFDDGAYSAHIPEIGYQGVTRYFADRDDPPRYANRSRKRMAEFLVRDAIPLTMFDCIIVKNDWIKSEVERMMAPTEISLPVYVKSGCYF